MNMFRRCMLSTAAIMLALSVAARAAPVDFDLPAQPLEASLKAVATRGGLNLVVTRDLLTGKTAPALKGHLEPAEALRRLTAGSGLAVTISGSDAVVSAESGAITLAPVSVTAETAPADGSAEAGYLVKSTTAAGPIWNDLPLQDAPYSITVVPSQLIDNLQAYQPEQIAKVVPQITNVLPQQNVSGNPFFFIRGFQVTQFTDGGGVTYDGLPGGAGGMLGTTLEDKERVEVLSGVDGFLYGMGSVGGNINYVLKRPTDTPYSSITIGDNAGDNTYVHGDFGGPLGNTGIFSYRLNVAGQNGDTSVNNESIKRDLLSLALDIRPTDTLLIRLNAAHSNYQVNGEAPSYGISLVPYPTAPNGALNPKPSWVQFIDDTNTGGIQAIWKPNNIFTVRTAYDYTIEDRPDNDSVSYTLENYEGLLKGSFHNPGVEQYYETHSGYAYLDTAFSVLDVQNKLTVGGGAFHQHIYSGDMITTFINGTSPPNNAYNPIQVSEPGTAISPYPATSSISYETNYVIGDEIKLTDQLTILAGGNLAGVGSDVFNPNGTSMAGLGYHDSALTPSASIIFKPLPWISTYATYQQSLQGGEAVLSSPGTIFTNSGTFLPPYIGNQYEVGVKATVGPGVLLTAALFDIDKANQYNVLNPDGTYTAVQSGREVHKGVEFTATGKALTDLTVFAGVTLLDPEVTDAPANPTYNGELPQDVSRYSAKIYAEYNLPYLHGLTLTGGSQYLSSSYNNIPNTVRVPSYMLFDVGLRYQITSFGNPVTLRFNVDNVTNKSYWAYPGYPGLPRTFLGTVQMQF